MNILNLSNNSFELFFKQSLKEQNMVSNYWKLEWQEPKSRYIFQTKNSNLIQNNVIVNGQGVDVIGMIYGFHVAIEIKECFVDSAYLSSKLTKKQKEYLTKFNEHYLCRSFVIIYFHQTNNLYIVKWPCKTKKITSSMKNTSNIWLYQWNDLSLYGLCNQIGGILISEWS